MAALYIEFVLWIKIFSLSDKSGDHGLILVS